jgi:hypothetical protein
MTFFDWLKSRPTLRVRRRPAGARLRVEVLEDRTVPSGVSFSLPVTYAVGGDPISMTVADFNGDGHLDLAVLNYANRMVGVMLGNGDGSFQATRYFGEPFPAISVAAGDFNRDGRLDLALTAGGLSVLLGNGDGTFQYTQTFAGGGYTLAVGDFNHDGIPDLAGTEGPLGGVDVSLCNGDGTFQAPQFYATGPYATGITVGDFNGDGTTDLAVTDPGNNTVSVLLGNGDGTFQPAQNFAAGSTPASVAVGDFNGDGKLDLAVGNASFNTVSVLLGNGDGTFQPAQNFAADLEPATVAVGDFNGDGKLDLAVGNAVNQVQGGVSVLLGNGDGTFQAPRNFPILLGGFYQGAFSLAVGDFNGDGRPDLAAGAAGASILLNQLVTTTTTSGPSSSTYGQPVTYTAAVLSSGTPVTAGTVTFENGNTPISPALPLDANGQATFSTATLNAGSYTITAAYSGTPDGAGTTGFGASTTGTSVIVNPAPLIAAAVNVSATAGAPWSGSVATFSNPDPFGSAASYTAVIDWGDGTTSSGAVSGTGTLTISGSHTYADPGSYAASVQISHNLGNTTPATVFPTATVTSLGLPVQNGLEADIGLWHNKNGQMLINAFNGGPNATALSTWLATNFASLYGAGAGADDLTGYTNAQVAAFYQNQFALFSGFLETQVLATALNVYATTLSLGGTVGTAYGFTVSADGLGAYSFNVGADGAAFGVANNTTLDVYALLQGVNDQAVLGVLYNGNTSLRHQAQDLFSALLQAGSIH